MSDSAVVRKIGARLKQYRLNRNLTQKQVSEKAGIHRSTLSAFENGTSASILTLVQILRALGELDMLDSFLPDPGPSPLQLAERAGKERKRASGNTDYEDIF